MNDNLSNRCFICHGTKNLTHSTICCGRQYYHPICFSTYCESSNKKCPICHKDIGNKLVVVTDRVMNWDYCMKTMVKVIIICIYISLAVSGYVMFEKVCKNSDKPYPTDIIITTLISPVCYLILYGCFSKSDTGRKEGCLYWIVKDFPLVKNILEYTTKLSLVLMILTPIILLVTSLISIYYSTKLGYRDVYLIYCLEMWSGNMLFMFVIIMHIFIYILDNLRLSCVSCVNGNLRACWENCLKNCFKSVSRYEADDNARLNDVL